MVEPTKEHLYSCTEGYELRRQISHATLKSVKNIDFILKKFNKKNLPSWKFAFASFCSCKAIVINISLRFYVWLINKIATASHTSPRSAIFYPTLCAFIDNRRARCVQRRNINHDGLVRKTGECKFP